MTHSVVSVHLNEFCHATLFQQYPPHQTHPKTLRSKAVKTTVEICFPSGFSFSHKSSFSSWSSFSSGSTFSGGSSVFRLRVRGVRFPYYQMSSTVLLAYINFQSTDPSCTNDSTSDIPNPSLLRIVWKFFCSVKSRKKI